MRLAHHRTPSRRLFERIPNHTDVSQYARLSSSRGTNALSTISTCTKVLLTHFMNVHNVILPAHAGRSEDRDGKEKPWQRYKDEEGPPE